MSFNRLRTQMKCEEITGCTDLDKWQDYRTAFERLSLDSQQVRVLKATLAEDAKDLYFKGLLSLAESIYSMSRQLYSWATVKAYYSIFYLLRSSLALRGFAVVKNKSLYLFPVKLGASPERKTADKYRNEHICVINIYRDLYGRSDILQSNNIDDLNSYEWLMERRNQINYRQREFYDPDPPEFLQVVSSSVHADTFSRLIATYVDDSKYLYCFQPDHACLALPIRRLLLTKKEFSDMGHPLNFSREKVELIRALLVSDETLLDNVDAFI